MTDKKTNYVDVAAKDILPAIEPKIIADMNEKLAAIKAVKPEADFTVSHVEWREDGLRLWLDDSKE